MIKYIHTKGGCWLNEDGSKACCFEYVAYTTPDANRITGFRLRFK